MKVNEFCEIITNPDRLRIIQQDEEIFVGFLGVLKLRPEIFSKIQDKTIIRFKASPEITHKQWKERNLTKPLEPEETPEFVFRDLQMKLYYTIYL